MAAIPKIANGDMPKMSFAKVAAASAPKNSASITTIARPPPQGPAAAPKAPRERQDNIAPNMPAPVTVAAAPVVASTPAEKVSPALPKSDISGEAADKVVEGLKDLKLEIKTPDLVINGSLSSTTDRSSKAGNSQTPSDDTSQRADSSSDLGTKPPSLDGKSITSGTTFALDEKESLRPDDSASVKAAAEDDDSLSVRGSNFAGSRFGSEVAARFHRIQIGDMPPRVISSHVLPGAQSQGLATPQSGGSEKQAAADVNLPLADGATASDVSGTNGVMSQNPDESLLEAMQSPKDRIFLLRLEQQVIEFVQDSKEPFMDFPPNNSFCRLLTHKLADYYHMTHSFHTITGAVRIYRTPFCRIPPSLSSIHAASTPNSSSPAPAILPRKIMRRGEGDEFGNASASPSKATSEAGSDAKDKATAREKLTREEREEEYNRARQRIFGDTEKSGTPGAEGEDGISRASSVSGKDRVNSNNKRKTKRRDDSEHFDTRSNYVAIPAGPQQPTWAPVSAQYYPVNNAQYNGQYHQPYPAGVQPIYGQAYPPYAPNNGFPPQYNAAPTYPSPAVPQAAPPQPLPTPAQQQQPPRYPTSNPAPPPAAAPYTSPMPTVPQPAWPQQGFTPAPSYPPARPTSATASGIPYAYGQLPANANPHDPKSQHPIPGSYNRQAFNPKTQSFVPGSGMVTMQPPAPVPYGNASPLHGSPQINTSHMAYNGYQQPLPPHGPGYVPGPAVGYNMVRQGSNNSMYHPVQQSPHAPQYITPNPPIAHTHIPNVNQGPIGHQGMPMPQQQAYAHLPNYGNPASLPQKPSN